eukprot:1162123-Pelagomonas_calceolata.AAC.4
MQPQSQLHLHSWVIEYDVCGHYNDINNNIIEHSNNAAVTGALDLLCQRTSRLRNISPRSTSQPFYKYALIILPQ